MRKHWTSFGSQQILENLYQDTINEFSNAKYSINWQKLDIGIMMGCVISPLIFLLVIEMLLRSTKVTTSKKTVPSMKAFMDDVTVISESISHMEKLLKRLRELFKRGVMKVKPSKSRSLSIIKGKYQEIKFAINNNIIPTIREKGVKSLGRCYSLPLTDRHRGYDLLKQIKDGLPSIDKCDLIKKDKLWCVYFGLIPRLAWPMQIYEVSLSRIGKRESLICKFLKKLLGVPKSLTNVALYSSSTKLKLPTKSLVEEFKLGKARLFQMLRGCEDPLVKSGQPAIITGRKWNAKHAVETAESSLKIKEVIGSVSTGRAIFGLHPKKWWSKETTKNKQRMVSEEIQDFEESKRLVIAVAQPKYGAWTRWENTKERTITWSDIKQMEPKQLGFLIKAVYDILPTPVNLKL